MNYPHDILPGPGRKLITCDLSGYFLQRIVYATTIDGLFDLDTQRPKFDQICHPRKNVIDFSTSLLGIYQPHYCGIEMTDEGGEKYYPYCHPDDTVEVPKYEVDFLFNKNKLFVIIPITEIKDREFEYLVGTAGNKEVIICRVVHTPTRGNFWHFSLHWDTPGGRIVSKKDRGANKLEQKVAHSVRVVISEICQVASPTLNRIPENCFMAN